MKLLIGILILALVTASIIMGLVYGDITDHKVGRCTIYENRSFDCEFNPNQDVKEATCQDMYTITGISPTCIGIKP